MGSPPGASRWPPVRQCGWLPRLNYGRRFSRGRAGGVGRIRRSSTRRLRELVLRRGFAIHEHQPQEQHGRERHSHCCAEHASLVPEWPSVLQQCHCIRCRHASQHKYPDHGIILKVSVSSLRRFSFAARYSKASILSRIGSRDASRRHGIFGWGSRSCGSFEALNGICRRFVKARRR